MYARKLLAGLATATLGVSVLGLSAGPASAAYTPHPDDPGFTPVAADLIGVGSDTTMGAMHLLGKAWNERTPAPAFRVASYAAVKAPEGGTIPLPGGEITRPNGSGAGKNLLYGAGDNADVDFARSSSANSPTETQAGLQMFPFALDTLRMAVSNNVASNAPASLSPAQLVGIYKGDITNWSQVGGRPGTIEPKTPQPGSGTRQFWDAQLRAMNGGVPVTYGSKVQEVQEHDDLHIKNDANAVAPFSEGRAALLGTTLRLTSAAAGSGWKADRAVYNVVRQADLGRSDIQALLGPTGFLCSAAALPLVERAGFRQLAAESRGGACGVATQEATSNFLLNEQVTTTTTVTVSSAAVRTARIAAAVTGSAAPSGTVSFYDGATLLRSGVALISGQATTTLTNVAPGARTYRAVFVPQAGSVFKPSEGTGSGVVKTSSAVTAKFPAKVKPGKKVIGLVTVALAGIGAQATGPVVVKAGSKTLATKALSGGKAKVTLPKLTKRVTKLTITWAGDTNAVGSATTATVKLLRKR